MRGHCAEGYRGRKSYRYADAGAPDQMGGIWEVVSALAQALTVARDQLVNLMNTSSIPSRMNDGGSRRVCPVRSYSPSAGTAVRNLHRNHAQGHVAFGSSTEYRLNPTPNRRPQIIPAKTSSQVNRSPNGRCTHLLHRMNPVMSPTSTRNLSPRRKPNVQLASGRASQCDRVTGRERDCVSINIGGNQREACMPCNRTNVHSCSTNRSRHCIGTQYAALLRQEVYQLRERRLAEENTCRKPNWKAR